MNTVKRVLIIANTRKILVERVVETAQKELSRRGIDFFLISPSYFRLDNKDLLTDIDARYKHRDYDLILAIGGDGTFLYTARTFLNFNIPIAGINAGRIGFLMEISPDELKDAMDKICSNQVELEKRMLLELKLLRDGRNIYHFPFLNDAVVSKGVLARMVEISLSLGNEALSQYRADGLIVSTPTGSTAYNLAAGGPILTPDIEAMIITPICPHTLGIRPIVTGSDKELKIHLIAGESDTAMTVDGQENFYLRKGDMVIIKKSERYIHIFDYGQKQFFGVLREKLGWHI